MKPATPVEGLFDLLDDFDQILVMTVEPGFGGQSFMPETMPKLRTLADEARRRGSSVWLQVDGGIGESTIAQAAEAGADTFVAGSAVFGAVDPDAAIAGLRARPAATDLRGDTTTGLRGNSMEPVTPPPDEPADDESPTTTARLRAVAGKPARRVLDAYSGEHGVYGLVLVTALDRGRLGGRHRLRGAALRDRHRRSSSGSPTSTPRSSPAGPPGPPLVAAHRRWPAASVIPTACSSRC